MIVYTRGKKNDAYKEKIRAINETILITDGEHDMDKTLVWREIELMKLKMKRKKYFKKTEKKKRK